MDYTILYVIGAVIFVIALTLGINYANKKNYINEESLNTIINVFGLSMAIIDEVGIAKDKEASKIIQAVKEALAYIRTYTSLVDKTTSTEKRIKIACNYCYSICEDLDIKLDDKRKNTIEQLITFGIGNIK